MKHLLKPLAESVLILLGLIAAGLGTGAAIHTKMFESGTHLLDLAKQRTLIASNEEMNHIMKIVKSIEESGLLIKTLAKQLKIKQKNKMADFPVY